MAEDPGGAAVRQQQCRKEANERRLPGAVLAQDRDGLTALEGERDAVESDPRLATEAALLAVGDPELLAELVELDRHDQIARYGLHGWCVSNLCHLMLLRGTA